MLWPGCLTSDSLCKRLLPHVPVCRAALRPAPVLSPHWAEACRAPGPENSGLPNSLCPRAPQRPARKGCLGAWRWWRETSFWQGDLWTSVQRKDLEHFLFCQKTKKLKAFRKPHPPRFRHLCDVPWEHVNEEMVLNGHTTYMSNARDPGQDDNSLHILTEQFEYASHWISCISWFNPRYNPLGQFYYYCL